MANEPLTLAVTADEAGLRLDVFLAARLPVLSRTAAKRAIEGGGVAVDGRTAKPRQLVAEGEQVAVVLPAPEPMDVEPEQIPLRVVYEDDHLLVIDKPAGMITHPAPGVRHGTLVNALLGRGASLSTQAGTWRPGIVHRLDKDTSGLLVVAKHDQAHRHLADQLRHRTAHRRYLALVWGDPLWAEQWVDQPIARQPGRRDRMCVAPDGRPARTQLRRLERFGLAALLEASLETGRTHQVRVHCTWLGYPLLGDPTYGAKRAADRGPLSEPLAAALAALPGQALHAAQLAFRHPADDREMTFAIPPPPEFAAVLMALRQVVAAGP